MDYEFGDKDLESLACDPAFSGGWDRAVVRAYRKRILAIDAALDERDLRAVKGNHFEKLKGNRAHQHSMRLNKQWRLILELRDGSTGRVVHVIGIEDYH